MIARTMVICREKNLFIFQATRLLYFLCTLFLSSLLSLLDLSPKNSRVCVTKVFSPSIHYYYCDLYYLYLSLALLSPRLLSQNLLIFYIDCTKIPPTLKKCETVTGTRVNEFVIDESFYETKVAQ